MEKSKKSLLALLLFIGILPLFLNGFYKPYISQTPYIYWTVEFATWILLPSGLLWIAFRNNLFRLSQIGIQVKMFGGESWILFSVSILVIGLLVVWVDSYAVKVALKLFPENRGMGSFSYKAIVPPAGLSRALILLYLCLSAAIVEELYFRGMFRLLFQKTSFGSFLYILISAITFSAVHWEGGIWNLTETFLFGVAASILYVLSGNLWPLIAGHALNDYFWFS